MVFHPVVIQVIHITPGDDRHAQGAKRPYMTVSPKISMELPKVTFLVGTLAVQMVEKAGKNGW